jgi:cysteine desulfurase/selenocysteine lyase
MSFDVAAVRADFPILSREVNKAVGVPSIPASAQKPNLLLTRSTRPIAFEYANVHRGLIT